MKGRMKGGYVALMAFVMVALLCAIAAPGAAESGKETKKPDIPYPVYGKGSTEVRLYTDYFCPPCRAAEPDLEPLIEDLVKRNVITLTFVDTPVRKYSSLYARYFLYALKEKNDLARALQIRHVLFDGAKRDLTDKEHLEALFREKGIPFASFDTTPVLARLNLLLESDRVTSTPTCVIIRDGKSRVVTGGPDIVSAIRALK